MSATVIPFAGRNTDVHIKRLRDFHDGFRVAVELGELAVRHHCSEDFQKAVWALADREAADAERKLSPWGVAITSTGSPDDKQPA